MNHLGRVGTAAYAEDLVDALNTIRHTFGGQVRVVHGYPICTTNIVDPVTIRALVEIEAWLDTVDLRRSHSLPETSKYFKDNILASPMDQSESNSFAAASIPLRMPASLFTKEKTAFVAWVGQILRPPCPHSLRKRKKPSCQLYCRSLTASSPCSWTSVLKLTGSCIPLRSAAAALSLWGEGAMPAGWRPRLDPSTVRWWI